jgi:hypothetical protein
MEVITRYRVDDLLTLANSWHGPGAHRHVQRVASAPHDHLATPGDARDFLHSHGMEVPKRPPSRRELVPLRELRRAVQRIADHPTAVGERALSTLVPRGSFRLDARGRLKATGSAWSAVASDLLLPLLELARARDRLKRCRNPACRWLFLDRSRNDSRLWCEMGVCGNRAKASRFRGRARTKASAA